jgi:hypothetical protein
MDGLQRELGVKQLFGTQVNTVCAAYISMVVVGVMMVLNILDAG